MADSRIEDQITAIINGEPYSKELYSRVEAILQSMIDNTPYDLPTYSRLEDLLLAWKEASASSGSDITVESLSVNENGTYTAPSGTAYSPVTVDTGIYTDTTSPASTLGKDGDYYYQRVNDFGALILEDDVEYRGSSNTWIGFDFATTNPITVTKIKTRLSNSTSIIYRIATSNEILYESNTIEGTAGENEIALSTPLRLAANVTYTAYVILGTNYGYYYRIQNVIGTGKGVVYNNGRCGENSSGTIPQSSDSVDSYAVDFEYETDDAYIKSEYRKKSGSWVQL